MSTKHPMPASDQSPCLLTLPPAEDPGLALKQFLNCGRSQRQSRTTGKRAAWVEAPTHREREEAAASRATEAHRGAAAPGLPASSSPSSESPRETWLPCRSTDSPGCPEFRKSPLLPPQGPREEDTGSRAARTLCGCRSPTSKSQRDPRAPSPLQPLRFCPTTSLHVTGVLRHFSA